MPGQWGFTYVAVLVALVLLALGSQEVMRYASQQVQRQREQTLLEVGAAYVRAIEAYYLASPGAQKRWPAKLDDLVEDQRQVAITRHIRELYPDPMTRRPDWELVRGEDGSLRGVRSRSTAAPVREGGGRRYSDWAFVARSEQELRLQVKGVGDGIR